MKRGKVKWIQVMKDHMNKLKVLIDYRVPYVVLVLKMIENFGVDMKRKMDETIKALNEITCATLNKNALKKVNGDYWICRVDEENKGQAIATRQRTDNSRPSGTIGEHYVIIPYIPPIDRRERFSRFE